VLRQDEHHVIGDSSPDLGWLFLAVPLFRQGFKRTSMFPHYLPAELDFQFKLFVS